MSLTYSYPDRILVHVCRHAYDALRYHLKHHVAPTSTFDGSFPPALNHQQHKFELTVLLTAADKDREDKNSLDYFLGESEVHKLFKILLGVIAETLQGAIPGLGGVPSSSDVKFLIPAPELEKKLAKIQQNLRGAIDIFYFLWVTIRMDAQRPKAWDYCLWNVAEKRMPGTAASPYPWLLGQREEKPCEGGDPAGHAPKPTTFQHIVYLPGGSGLVVGNQDPGSNLLLTTAQAYSYGAPANVSPLENAMINDIAPIRAPANFSPRENAMINGIAPMQTIKRRARGRPPQSQSRQTRGIRKSKTPVNAVLTNRDCERISRTE